MNESAALVPVRSFRGGKSRLGAALPSEEREALVRSMVRHVLGAIEEAGVVRRIFVVSPDPDTLAAVTAFGDTVEALAQEETRPGLNAALGQGRDRALATGATSLLVLFADLPLLEPDDVRAMAEAPGRVVLAPDRRGIGTNGLRLDLIGDACAFRFSFGEASAGKHRAEAARLGLPVAVIDRPGTAFDLDTPDDLREMEGALLLCGGVAGGRGQP